MTPQCNHFWRAVDSRRSQCAKCGEITKGPCREPECESLRAKVERLEAAIRRTVDWSLFRSVLVQGADIHKDYLVGTHANYDAYARRLDTAAHERVEQVIEKVLGEE